ncbi:MAG: hypothetical protein OXE42_17145 [Gammaproteobacteria bacterium]|nr:hypothetical protein [Gammaproteobacteria bacterium]
MLTDNSILPRHLSARLLEALTYSRVVNIIGPRQAGTTTLVRDILNMGKFITLDDQNTLSAIEDDPSGQLESLLDWAVSNSLAARCQQHACMSASGQFQQCLCSVYALLKI